jgi:hypothetical protein
MCVEERSHGNAESQKETGEGPVLFFCSNYHARTNQDPIRTSSILSKDSDLDNLITIRPHFLKVPHHLPIPPH